MSQVNQVKDHLTLDQSSNSNADPDTDADDEVERKKEG